MIRVLHVVGARPNFVKAAPVMAALAARGGVAQALVHTGQHYDIGMSEVFFRELGLPEPDTNLDVGSGSHAQQTGRIMLRLEEVLLARRPGLVLAYGDVNSTLAAVLVCAKLLIPFGHVEAGLRSFDRTMPEEINRVLTDQIADLLYTPSPDGDENLLREGIAQERIHRVGNVMIDTLLRLLPEAERSTILSDLGLTRQQYAVLTLHRPGNVDDDQKLERLLGGLLRLSRRLAVVFPAHPRTMRRIRELGLELHRYDKFVLVEPLGYVDFLRLMSQARLVVTDSGGIQEETTCLGIPCLTLRANTERPITVEMGTNTLIGSDLGLLARKVDLVLEGDTSWDKRPTTGIPLWDGRAAERITDVLISWFGERAQTPPRPSP